MQVKAFTHEDIQGLPALQPPDWLDITPHFRYYLDSPACFPFKVWHNEQLAGVGVRILHEDTAWLAHIVVHPGFRNLGIGTFLTQDLIEGIDRSIYKTIYLMATPLGEPVYRKLGFIAESGQLFFRDGRSFADFAAPPQIMPLAPGYIDEVLRMDREVYGENRSLRLREHLPGTWMYLQDRVFIGFYMPGFSEGLILAKDPHAGIELMHLRLTDHPSAIVPEENTQAVRFLYDQGFKVFRTATRMRLGASRTWRAECIYNRVSGQLG